MQAASTAGRPDPPPPPCCSSSASTSSGSEDPPPPPPPPSPPPIRRVHGACTAHVYIGDSRHARWSDKRT
eukprot:4700229-Pyramimonas_sp.AAC.1